MDATIKREDDGGSVINVEQLVAPAALHPYCFLRILPLTSDITKVGGKFIQAM